MKRKFFILFLVMAAMMSLWIVLLSNPRFFYKYQTRVGQVTIFHDEEIDESLIEVVEDAVDIIKTSSLYSPGIQLFLCLNDNKRYKELWIYKGGIAYSFLNKAVMYHGVPDPQNNLAHYNYNDGNYENKVDLTWLLAHEFTHNLQYAQNPWFPLSTDFWKSEGHAEYISRQWKNDEKLIEKRDFYLAHERLDPRAKVIIFDDGSDQNKYYFKSGLAAQYLMEVEGLDFASIKKDERSLDEVWEMLEVYE